MADSKITDLTADTAPTGDDLVNVVNDPAGTPASKKVTLANLAASAPFADLYVADTGTQTIAGVKTFSSDPLIPDEAYSESAWNGVLEPPTKNAVRDALEALPALAAGDGIDVSGGTVSTEGPDYQVFDATGTWTKPAGAKSVFVTCIGGGGGGGSGRRGAASSARYGGGGGAAGFTSEGWFSAASLGATEQVTVGTGGAGGAANSTNDNNGSQGVAGTLSSFGSTVVCLASPGEMGSGGSATNGLGATIDGIAPFTRRGSFRVSPGASSSITATPTAPNSGHVGVGGAGGGIDTGNTARAGGPGSGASGAASGAGGAVGANGTAGPAANTSASAGAGGGGGGGAESGGTCGAGAVGGLPGGGGGGSGAAINSGQTSPAGGTGGAGRVVIITFR